MIQLKTGMKNNIPVKHIAQILDEEYGSVLGAPDPPSPNRITA
jgi:hypothetical protein